MFNDYAPMNR